MSYRISTGQVATLFTYLKDQLDLKRDWAVVEYRHISLRHEDIKAFDSREKAEQHYAEKKLSEESAAIVPLNPLFDIVSFIYRKSFAQEMRIESMHVDLDAIRSNYYTQRQNFKTNNMIQENLEYLQQNVKYMGFGDKLKDAIAKNMEQGVPDFTLKTDALFNNKKIEGELSFRKSDNSDMYFFNRYKASMGQGDDARSQTFYIDNGKGITFKEAFNLLEGRAVHKELTNKEQEKYNAWVQLDFSKTDKNNNFELKRFTEGYGFDLDKTVKALPIKELGNDDDSKKLIASLAKGNVQSVTVLRNGGEEKMFIEAAPQFKTVNIYDGQMKPLSKEQKHELTGAGETKQTATQGKKETPAQKEDSLLQKKRVSNKKGLSIA